MHYIDMNVLRQKLRVIAGHMSRCAPEWQWDSHKCPWKGKLLLWIIAGGRGNLKSGETSYELGPGDCFVLRLSERNIGRHDPENPLFVPWVVFEILDGRGRSVNPSLGALKKHRHMRDVQFMSNLCERSIIAHERGDSGSAEQWLRSCLVEVLDQDSTPGLSGPADRHVQCIEEICATIREAPGARYALEEMSEKMHCTKDHFIRLFRKIKGATPGEFVVRSRIDAAKSLLSFSSSDVNQIAEILGYTDSHFFCRQFKKRTGHTPSEYRQFRPE